MTPCEEFSSPTKRPGIARLLAQSLQQQQRIVGASSPPAGANKAA